MIRLSILLIVLIFSLSSARISRMPQVSYSRDSDSIADSLLFIDKNETEKWLQKNNIPALGIGFIEDGKIKETSVYNGKRQEKTYPLNSIFNVASLTKPVTAMLVLKLVNDGKWKLDEPISRYWTDPDVQDDPRSKKLTTRQILSHQTGFPNWRRKSQDGKLAFEFEPGTKFQYSGEGFEYLRRALEKKFKRPLEQLADEWIFKPLKMKDTRFYWDSTVNESRFARWYRKDGSMYETYKNRKANAADDLLTTVEDYSRFLLHVMKGAGLKKSLYRQMVSEQVRIKPRKFWGLGWYADEDVNGTEDALLHGGDDIGVHAMVFILPESEKALLIFTNCDNGTDIYIRTVQHYLGKAGEEIVKIETQ